ncbi:MAG TPA: type II toxin-antitoxin system VapC family toxin [Rhodocyclaceae bacterium]
MSDYIDTSALVKRYLAEPLSDEFDAYLTERPGAAISPLTVVELRCALARRRRSKDISRSYETAAMAAFDADVQQGCLEVVAIDNHRFQEARRLIDQIADLPLRTLDALHLATAQVHRCKAFATADKTQAEAARALGFQVHSFY